MITDLIRSNLRGFKPYSSAQSLSKGIFMDANENSLGSVISNQSIRDLTVIRSYSLGYAKHWENFGNFKNIFVGNGSDELWVC